MKISNGGLKFSLTTMDVNTGFLEDELKEFENLQGEVQDVDALQTKSKFKGPPSVSYAPSIAQTDFSGFLPMVSNDDEVQMIPEYDPDVAVNAAWNGLNAENPKMPWETDFWESFFDPTVSAFDQLTKGFKRPMPYPMVDATASAAEVEVERRVASKPFPAVKSFLKNIKDISEKSWQEERDALWEMAIRRWVAMLDSWHPESSLLVQAVQQQESFKDKAQILVDVFYNKAPQTLIKRVNSISKLCGALAEQGTQFPCDEDAFYNFLKFESQRGAPASRLKAFFESVVFSRHVLGIEKLQTLIDSRRCLGAVSQKSLACPRQATPFSVLQLRKFHEVLRDGDEIWDRAMAGMILFCTYSRARWSDAQHAEELIEDRDNQNTLHFLEVKSAVHKTARSFHLRHMFLPLAAPAAGVTDDAWGEQWIQVREKLQITNLSRFPLMPAPDACLEPTRRPISTQEAKQWMLYLLGSELIGTARLSSHSCKCTCLSYMAKRGASFEDRLILGYHSNRLRVGLTYSRDSSSRPLSMLSHVLMEIRKGIFEPDASRSGRLRADAVPLDRVEFFAQRAEEPVRADGSEPETRGDEDRSETDDKSWQKVSEVIPDAPVEIHADGHVTTDSSDSSDGEHAWAPVIGHYTISVPDSKSLWLNQNSKMFHLSYAEHVKVLLCGRRIGQNFKQHSGLVRYDSAKCRQCFRLKDS